MRELATQKILLSKISHYLNNCLVIGIVIGIPITVRAQSFGQPPAGLPESALVSGGNCRSTQAVSGIENKIPRLVNSARWRELQTVADQLVRACPDSDVGYHWVGVSYLRQGRSFAAIRAFEDSLRKREDAGAHLLLAEAYYELGQKQFFWEEIDAAKKMAPQESGIYYLAGLFCFQTEQANEKAAEWFRMALDRNPKHLLAQCHLALCLQGMQQYKEAESTLLAAVGNVSGTNAQALPALQLLISLELEMNQPSDALNHARLASQIAPNSVNVQLALGKAAMAAHDQPTALAAFKAADALDPESPEAHYLLSRVYRAQGQDQMAEEEIATFKRLRQLYHGSFE
jgi:tetratricopeptide (TPR) repeat protein